MTRLPVHQPRTCGSCSACCHVLRIDEVQSPMFSRCRHVRADGGCGIYEERPESCRGMNCSWLLGHYGLTEKQRPDKLGVVVWTGESTYGPAIHVGEYAAGALDRSDVRLVVRELANRGVPVIELRRDGTQTVVRAVVRR